jgi:acetyltransferase-like isoleucine patch superfamily enzyme
MWIKNKLLYILSLIVVVFPVPVKIFLYRNVFGYKIGKHVSIGLSWIYVNDLIVDDNVIIRHFNRFKGIPCVRIGHDSVIGFGNTFTSTQEFTCKRGVDIRHNNPSLIVGEHCGITMLHYFDIQDSFSVGPFTTIAGRQSIFYTHYIDVSKNSQSTKPISIGSYCMIGSAVRFAPGACISDYCVVGIGAVVVKNMTEKYKLIGGNPAVNILDLNIDSKYFHRDKGWVSHYVGGVNEGSTYGYSN